MVAAPEFIQSLCDFRLANGLFRGDRIAALDELDLDGFRVPRITNEFWPARQRQGHSLHEVSYRACFKAELPRFFIGRLTEPDDRVLDPFMGRGTTVLEAALLGRTPIGNDVNPLSRILILGRLAPQDLDAAAARIDVMLGRKDPGPAEDDPELDAFYHEDTLADLRRMKAWFGQREADGELDPIDAWLRSVATNRLTGHSSGFFSGRTMPPNQAVSIETQRKINARLGVAPPKRDVKLILLKKSRSLLRSVTPADLERLERARKALRLVQGDAGQLDGIEDDSVQCTITSPPFLNVVNYARDNWLRCWFNRLDATAIGKGIVTTGSLTGWCAFLERVFAELFRVTCGSGWVVFEVGEVRGGKIRLDEAVIPVAARAGFEPVGVAVHSQNFTKTANCWGVSNNAKGTNTNRLVLLRKPAAGARA